MASSSQTGSAGSAIPWKYDVFLSFRGTDTRKGFTDHLYRELQRQGIKTFRDDPQLEKGTTILSELLAAIEQSRFAIVVLSPNYATSTWCLLELSYIVESMEERGRILPIFYEVEPSHVRHQKRSFAEAFEEHEEKFGEGNKEVERWRGALTKVANLNGWSSEDYKYETQLIREIVQELWSKVHPRLPQPLINERPLEPTVGLDSMLEKVWSHVEDAEVGVIGLYGMGGVGKTTLLTQIHNKFQHTDFDVAIWIVVSKDLRVEAIQNRIAGKIGLRDPITWDRKDPYEKADAISSLLGRKKFVLFLDDLWERVDITKIGVPFPDRHNKCKVVFTTRSADVCGVMCAQQKILVECLPWDKAWSLFQENTGKEALQIHADIPKLAEAVAKECDGLPLALTTVGRVMSSKKTPEEWNHAIRVLTKASFEFSVMGDQVFPVLKCSYDNFPSDKVRACFLYCSIFPEGFAISKDRLVKLWMCENLLNEHTHLEEARYESYHIIGTLLNACMLEEGNEGCVEMHDVVRNMALWLTRDPKKAR